MFFSKHQYFTLCAYYTVISINAITIIYFKFFDPADLVNYFLHNYTLDTLVVSDVLLADNNPEAGPSTRSTRVGANGWRKGIVVSGSAPDDDNNDNNEKNKNKHKTNSEENKNKNKNNNDNDSNNNSNNEEISNKDNRSKPWFNILVGDSPGEKPVTPRIFPDVTDNQYWSLHKRFHDRNYQTPSYFLSERGYYYYQFGRFDYAHDPRMHGTDNFPHVENHLFDWPHVWNHSIEKGYMNLDGTIKQPDYYSNMSEVLRFARSKRYLNWDYPYSVLTEKDYNNYAKVSRSYYLNHDLRERPDRITEELLKYMKTYRD